MSDMTYTEALNYLVRCSEWSRKEIEADGESAAWHIAAKAQRAGVVVSRGKP